ncbi:MAG: alpha/beta hydrolase [Atopobiaceae bacterium]|nr:alpha/beta hydrolase [Atopobiaceae bacterium]
MFDQTFNYTEDGRVYMKTYGLDLYSGMDGKTRPAIVVFPGGGYTHQSTSEAEPVAITWAARGYSVFVLYYSVMEYAGYPELLEEAAWSIKTVRDHAEEFHVDPDRIAVMGFSAGANLASMIGTQWHEPFLAEKYGCESEYLRPNAAVLGYGVYDIKGRTSSPVDVGRIMAEQDPHASTIDFIDERTVPSFICATRYDEVGACRQSLEYALRMDDFKLPYEIMITNSGVHGLSVNNRVCVRRGRPIDDCFARWVDSCDLWLQRTFGEVEWISPENAGFAFL